MSTTLDPREVEAATSPDSDTQLPASQAAEPPSRPHEPGARPAPLSRLLYP